MAKKVPAFDRSVHTKAGARLGELVDEIFRLHGRILSVAKPSQLASSAQTIVLAAVVLAQEPPTAPRIARSIGHSTQAIQRIVDALVERGLVEYQDNPHHKKSRHLVATAMGKRIYAEANRESASWTSRIAAGLGEAELVQCLDLLRKVRDRLEHDR